VASLKSIRRKAEAVRKHLEKARAGLVELREFRLKSLRPDCAAPDPMPDGSLCLDLGPDPLEGIVHAIDKFLGHLSPREIPPDAGGIRATCWRQAVHRLQCIIEHQNPALTSTQRETLRHELFDKVRERHGHQSRIVNHDSDMPRYRDLLAKRPTQ